MGVWSARGWLTGRVRRSIWGNGLYWWIGLLAADELELPRPAETCRIVVKELGAAFPSGQGRIRRNRKMERSRIGKTWYQRNSFARPFACYLMDIRYAFAYDGSVR